MACKRQRNGDSDRFRGEIRRSGTPSAFKRGWPGAGMRSPESENTTPIPRALWQPRYEFRCELDRPLIPALERVSPKLVLSQPRLVPALVRFGYSLLVLF